MLHIFFTALILWVSTYSPLSAQFESNIHPTDVIKFEHVSTNQYEDGTLESAFRLQTSQNFSIYVEQLKFEADYEIFKTKAPAAKKHFDEVFQKEMGIYEGGEFFLYMKSLEPVQKLKVKITFTGCTGTLCLFPYTQEVDVDVYQNRNPSPLETQEEADTSHSPQSSVNGFYLLLYLLLIPVGFFFRKQPLKLFFAVFMICIPVSYIYFFNTQPREMIWRSDLETALEDAKKTGTPVFIDNWAEWCVACIKMDKTVFMNKEVIKELNANWISVKVDLTEESEVSEAHMTKFHVASLPTTTLVTFKNNEMEIQNIIGYKSAEEILAHLKLIK